MPRVLVAEDEPALADALTTGLRRRGHIVATAYDGVDARQQVKRSDFDVVVLDRGLPYVSGDEICEEIVAAQVGARVIMVTAAVAVAQRVEGLRLGADDYLTKPFAFDELAARVDALARRPVVRGGRGVLSVGDITIDPRRRMVQRAGRPVDLAVKEFGVLTALAMQPGSWLSTEMLREQVWDQNTDPSTSAVKVTMSSLRRKLGQPQVIETQRGVGYRLRCADDD